VGQQSARETFRAPSGSVDLEAIDPRGRPLGPRTKAAAADELVEIGARLDQAQEELFAEAAAGGQRRVLLLLQGMDTSGKGGTIRHVVGLVNPAGLHIASFKKPTPAELSHHFLWRIRKQVPAAGRLGVFDRSQYEDVLIVRVESLVPESVWRPRYAQINDFEAEIAEQGVTMIKCFLHISPAEQTERLLARLDDPTKRWKYNPSDVDARKKWFDYMAAYTEALQQCSTDVAPWYVIPGDRKWYRNWVVAKLLDETFRDLAPRYPEPDYDLATERARVLDSEPAR